MGVVVGAAIVREGRVLAARRSSPAALAGGWEFPGGKVEPGETERQALVRECVEELGVRVRLGERVGPDTELPAGRTLKVWLAAIEPANRSGGGTDPQALQEHDELRWLQEHYLECGVQEFVGEVFVELREFNLRVCR